MRLLCYFVRKLCFWYKHGPISCLFAFSYYICFSSGELLTFWRDFKFSKPKKLLVNDSNSCPIFGELLGSFLNIENLYAWFSYDTSYLHPNSNEMPFKTTDSLHAQSDNPHHWKKHVINNLEGVLYSSRHIRILITFSQSNQIYVNYNYIM